MKKLEVLWVVFFVAIDQISKYIFDTNIDLHGSKEVINNFFYLTYAQNTGAGWSLFSDYTRILGLVSLLVVVCIIVWLFKNKNESSLYRFGIVMVLAGALGNMIDRFRLGYVVDFLDFYILGYDFPIFNIADIGVSLGVGLLLILTLFNKEKQDV